MLVSKTQVQGFGFQVKQVPAGRSRQSTIRCGSGTVFRITDDVSISTDVIGLLIGSAAPFIVVQSFADSKAGKDIFESLKREKPRLEREAAAMENRRSMARRELRWYGNERPLWVVAGDSSPPWLDGTTYPGDYGFDPLKLGREKQALDKYFELELLHARWAMLGALGAVIPEILNHATPLHLDEPRWWNVGAYKLNSGEDLNYFGIEGLRIAGNQGIMVIAVCQIVLMFGPEYARSCGIEALEPLGIFLPGDKNYPGGWLFDPLNLSRDPRTFELMKIREIKNGRLAMVAWVFFGLQAYLTKDGILDWIFNIMP
jgi:light-harvesting complex II chlorophyll a/b binding protein 7